MSFARGKRQAVQRRRHRWTEQRRLRNELALLADPNPSIRSFGRFHCCSRRDFFYLDGLLATLLSPAPICSSNFHAVASLAVPLCVADRGLLLGRI